MKKDQYLRVRGGKAKILGIYCAQCGAWVLRYQKDGPGQLLRCYLNRIFDPPELEKLQREPKIMEPKNMVNLACPRCKAIIGTPVRHMDGRLAFHLRKGTYSKKQLKGDL